MPRGKQVDSRSKQTEKRLEMYKSGKAKRDKKGRVLYQEFQSKDTTHEARVQPDRRWFGPARTVPQQELQKFQEDIKTYANNPNTFILKAGNVPYSLLREPEREARMNLLTAESFESTFGKKSARKRPKLSFTDVEELAKHAEEKEESYSVEKDRNIKVEADYKKLKKDPIFSKGQSHRIWGELFKVLDSSDIVIEVLDARDPLGTRAYHVEQHLKKNMRQKQLVLLLNKADLIPSWVLKRWLHLLSKEYPVLAFHASMKKSFGKGALIQVLRQFQHLHSDKQQISVGFIGYPNVGKSSVINTLKHKKVAKAAPVPGETKVWQYITLFRKIFLVDCPGVVYPSGDTESDIVLKGVVRIENLDEPVEHIPQLLTRVKPDHLTKTYGIETWTDHIDFLTQFAKKAGRLLKQAEPDLNTVARMMLNDWLRGKIPFFVPPPATEADLAKQEKQKTDAAVEAAQLTGSDFKEAAAAAKQDVEEEKDDATKFRHAPVMKQSLRKLEVREEFKDEEQPDDIEIIEDDDDGFESDDNVNYSDEDEEIPDVDKNDDEDDDEVQEIKSEEDEAGDDFDAILAGGDEDGAAATTVTTVVSKQQKPRGGRGPSGHKSDAQIIEDSQRGGRKRKRQSQIKTAAAEKKQKKNEFLVVPEGWTPKSSVKGSKSKKPQAKRQKTTE